MQDAPSLTPWPWALLIGLAFGTTLQRTHFCTMGCISDAVLFGSLRRLRVWSLAVAVAILGSQALDGAGLVDLGQSDYLRLAPHRALAAALGGVLFGFGMVQAGGCVSRNLARLGAGSLKALTALLATAMAAGATWALVPSPVLVAATPSPAWMPLLGVAVSAVLLAFCLLDQRFRGSVPDLATGAVLGILIPLGWLATSLSRARPDSVNYLAPDHAAFTLPLLVGTVLGAFVAAHTARAFRVERFTAAGDLRRHLLGGALTGCGGALASGCTIGQGMTGVSTLAPASFLALAGMLGGAWWGVKHLETGRLLPPLWPSRQI